MNQYLDIISAKLDIMGVPEYHESGAHMTLAERINWIDGYIRKLENKIAKLTSERDTYEAAIIATTREMKGLIEEIDNLINGLPSTGSCPG